ncbi:MAG: F0F1 ATP synthase subunit epsilon [Geminicoccaceae bacterium]
MADGNEDKVAFELVSPERLLASEQCDMVVVPGEEGDFGVLPLHAPFMSVVRPGVIEIYQGNSVDRQIFVAGGFAEVNEEGCIVLAEEAVPVDEMDRAAIEKRLDTAQRDLADLGDGGPEKERVVERIKVAEAMLEVLDRAA